LNEFDWESNDDGEPSGTAGRPIIKAIKNAGLSGVVTLVSRYYGGVKLGVGGLKRAYQGVASEALQAGGVAPFCDLITVEVNVPLELSSKCFQIPDAITQILPSSDPEIYRVRLTLPRDQLSYVKHEFCPPLTEMKTIGGGSQYILQ